MRKQSGHGIARSCTVFRRMDVELISIVVLQHNLPLHRRCSRVRRHQYGRITGRVPNKNRLALRVVLVVATEVVVEGASECRREVVVDDEVEARVEDHQEVGYLKDEGSYGGRVKPARLRL